MAEREEKQPTAARRPSEPPVLQDDRQHLEATLALSMSERLERAFAWNRFASRLRGAARRTPR